VRKFSRDLLLGAVVCAAYYAAGRMGLSAQAINKYATFIWAPTGIALGSLFLLGVRFWPAIIIGSFTVNFVTGAPFFVALGISSGNTLEVLTSVYLLRRSGFQNFFRYSDAIKFIFLGIPLGTFLSATIGVGCLWLASLIPSSQWIATWGTWWIGDALGALIVAPLAIVWYQWQPIKEIRPLRVLEAVTLAGCVFFLSCYMFLNWFDVDTSEMLRPHLYLLFPLLIWAAVRFGPRGGISVLFFYALVATWTLLRHPLFFPSDPKDTHFTGFFQLGTFLLIAGVTELILATVFEERRNAIQTRDEFFNIASHELKTPLTSLRLQTQIALRKLQRSGEKGLSLESMANLLNLNDVQIGKINHLIEEMFDVARINAGSLQLDVHEMDFSETLREVLTRLSAQISAAGCEVRLEAEKNTNGRWDRARLEQVIENLIGNACKYGSGKPIEMKVSTKNNKIRFSIKDHGIGIEKSEHLRIFNQFERGALVSHVGGLGLGLYIVIQIVKKHDGQVKVESELGKGATFTLELPRHSSL